MGIFGNKIENYKLILTHKETGEEKFVQDKSGEHDRIWLSKTEATMATRILQKDYQDYQLKIMKIQ